MVELVALTVGVDATVTVAVLLPLQPLIVPVTVYTVVKLGDTVNAVVVAPVFQL